MAQKVTFSTTLSQIFYIQECRIFAFQWVEWPGKTYTWNLGGFILSQLREMVINPDKDNRTYDESSMTMQNLNITLVQYVCTICKL